MSASVSVVRSFVAPSTGFKLRFHRFWPVEAAVALATVLAGLFDAAAGALVVPPVVLHAARNRVAIAANARAAPALGEVARDVEDRCRKVRRVIVGDAKTNASIKSDKAPASSVGAA